MKTATTNKIVHNLAEIGAWRSFRDGGLCSRVLFKRDGEKVLWQELSTLNVVFDFGVLKEDGPQAMMESANHPRTRSRLVEPLKGQAGYIWRTLNDAATGTLFPK